MAQRVYLIVLDADESAFNGFEDEVNEILGRWNETNHSGMDNVNLTIFEEDDDELDDDDDSGYHLGDFRDDADTMDEMADAVAVLQREIQKAKGQI